jgi:hypothetical protein
MQTLFNSQTHLRRRNTGAVQIRILLVAVAVVITVIGFMRYASPERQIEKKQATLIRGIEQRKRSKVERLIADNYSDRWGFDKQDAVTAFLDVGSQFVMLGITELDPIHEIANDSATVTTRLKIGGTGSPVANFVTRRANQIKTPFVFEWKKQSWWPGSWRLVKVDNPDLPADLEGYEPGDIKRAMSPH